MEISSVVNLLETITPVQTLQSIITFMYIYLCIYGLYVVVTKWHEKPPHAILKCARIIPVALFFTGVNIMQTWENTNPSELSNMVLLWYVFAAMVSINFYFDLKTTNIITYK